MINKENNKEEQPIKENNDDNFVDKACMDVQCHIMIKDKDTGEVLVNRRG